MLRIKRCKTNQKEEKTMSELRDELLQETTGGCPEERTVLGGMPKINPDEKYVLTHNMPQKSDDEKYVMK